MRISRGRCRWVRVANVSLILDLNGPFDDLFDAFKNFLPLARIKRAGAALGTGAEQEQLTHELDLFFSNAINFLLVPFFCLEL